jgi:hypothetical protein
MFIIIPLAISEEILYGKAYKMNKKKIIFHSTAWGRYREMYKEYTLPSIQYDIEELKKEGYECVYSQGGFDLDSAPEKFDTKRAWNPSSAILLQHLRSTIQDCIDEDAIMVLIMPDTIYGKGSIYNCIKLQEGKNVQVAIPHLRAVAKDEWKGKSPTCRELVNYCFDAPHDTFIKSFDNLELNSTWAGISVRKLNDKMYTLTHSLPTVYVAKFNAHDLQFWEYAMDFGFWDRNWLKQLWHDNRLKVIGSSDIAFCVEMRFE